MVRYLTFLEGSRLPDQYLGSLHLHKTTLEFDKRLGDNAVGIKIS